MIEIPIFKYKDIDINYVKKGKGEPLLMFQGWGTTIDGWTFQIPFFRKKMMIIALDNRGVGGSSRPNYPYTMDMFIDEAKALLDFLGIQEKIHVIGISMGGMTALNFVLKYPNIVKTLTLLATTAAIDLDGFNSLLDQYKTIMEDLDEEEGFKRKLELMFSEAFIHGLDEDEVLYNIVYDTLMRKNTTTMQDLINRGAAIKGHDVRDLISKISQPTLIMHGTADKMVPFKDSELLHETLPNSKLVPLEGFGHGSVLIEDAERVNAIIWDFIKDYID